MGSGLAFCLLPFKSEERPDLIGTNNFGLEDFKCQIILIYLQPRQSRTLVNFEHYEIEEQTMIREISHVDPLLSKRRYEDVK